MPTVVQDVSGDSALQNAIAALKAKIEGAEESSDIAQAVSDINTALAGKQNTLTFDSAPSSGSTNPVTSDGVKTALDGKQDTLTFDTEPTAESTKPVTSGGVKEALDSVDSEIGELKENITAVDDVVSTVGFINRFNRWMVGAYMNADGGYRYRTDYLCTPSKIQVSSGNIIELKINIDFVLQYMYVLWYDSNNSYIGHSAASQANQFTFIAPENAAHFNISISKLYAEDMTISDYLDTTLYVKNPVSGIISVNNSVLVNNSGLLFLTNWANRIYYFGQGIFGPSVNRIGLQATFKTQHRYRITAKDGYNITAGAFTDATPSVSAEAGITGWVTECILEKDTYYICNCRKADNSNLTPDEYGVNPYITIEKLSDGFTDYAVTGFAKTGVTVSQVGTLPNGFQAFCKYNGDIYSVQEDNIYHINGETFALLNSAEISVGHANSIQLGSGNIAYISGWNDQKVYAVNLDTLAVSTEYTLPIGDTTTVAVDDINNLMYIFHKADDPGIVGYYDFIVYNYDTEQIISSKKITVPFAAMQSCQFVNGLIFTANGLATASAPNGYRVYNTNGDVVQSYVLLSITSEPEGVFYDKDTNKLLISDAGRRVYQIV